MITPGWKKKAEKLRMIILSAEIDLPLPPELAHVFEVMRRFRKGQADTEALQRAIDAPVEVPQWLWEPFSDMRGEPQPIYGWMINATMYQLNGQNWWLVSAERRPSNTLPEKDMLMLGKVLDVLGGHIEHDALSIGALDDNAREGVPFMWTWFNQAPLYEVQVSKAKKDIRIVPRGAPESNGYAKLKRPS